MHIYVNNIPIEQRMFAGGECHVNVAACDINPQHTTITAYLYSAADIMHLLLTVDAVRRQHAHAVIHLVLPYMPYARQDRVCNSGEALSIAVMAQLINGLNCASITVFDPHSDVTGALLHNVQVRSMADLVMHSPLAALVTQQNLILVAPDAGAQKKVAHVAHALGVPMLCAYKQRDSATGAISNSVIHGTTPQQSYLLLDDICDGGRTFIALAQVLQQQQAAQVYLYTTHGIYSHGLDVLRPWFKQVYCWHTMLPTVESDFLTVLGDVLCTPTH